MDKYPIKKEVKVIRWDCGNKKHNHLTREVAERCYMMSLTPKKSVLNAEEIRLRNVEVFRVFAEHEKYHSMTKACKITGAEVSLSGTTVRHIVHRIASVVGNHIYYNKPDTAWPTHWPDDFIDIVLASKAVETHLNRYSYIRKRWEEEKGKTRT